MWRELRVFHAVYRQKKTGTLIKVHSLTRPPKYRLFRARGGLRKFECIQLTSTKKEFIIIAKDAKTKADEVTDDELAELENLEGAEPEEEETETQDEAPVKTKKNKKGKKDKDPSSKKGKKGKAPKESRAAANGKIGTQEIVKHVNDKGLTDKPIDARQLRMVLRKHRGEKGIELDSESGRWEWDSIDAKPVKAIIGFVKAGEVEAVKQEGLDRLKAQKDAKAKTKESDGKKGKKNKKDKKGKKKNKAEGDDE